jgi:hypothetical protein
MVKEVGFWTSQQGPTGMDLSIEELDPEEEGAKAYYWWMEDAADQAPAFEMEVLVLTCMAYRNKGTSGWYERPAEPKSYGPVAQFSRTISTGRRKYN